MNPRPATATLPPHGRPVARGCRYVAVLVSGALAVGLGGCKPQTGPLPPVDVPPRGEGPLKRSPEMRPLPRDADPERVGSADLRPPAFDDVPLVDQAAPEEPAFVAAYQSVGSPRVALFVNRGFDGDVLPTADRRTIVGSEDVRRSTGPVTVETSDDRRRGRDGIIFGRRDEQYRRGPFDPDGFDRYDDRPTDRPTDRFESTGPAEYRRTSEVYLPPGEYDEVDARRIDYAAVETAMADFLAAGGRVTLVAPDLARDRLTDEQVSDLTSGRPVALRQVARALDADVLVQVQAKPTRQTERGLEVRLVAQAMNTKGGELLGRAVVDVPPPLTKTRINAYTRFLARKLMSDLTASWKNAPAPKTNP